MDATTSLIIDPKDRILTVNENWDRFALENNGETSLSQYVKQRSLFDFIKGDQTRMIIDVLLNRARLLDKSNSHEYRCDSPGWKRFMRMNVLPREDKHLQIEHILLRQERMQKNMAFEYREKSKASYIHRCSLCNKIYVNGEWQEPDEAVANGQIAEMTSYPVVYQVCPNCQMRVERVAEQMLKN